MIVIPHHADVLPRLGQQPQPQVLDLVGVLVLVDHDVLETLLVLLKDLAVGPQDVQHVEQQIAEIAGVQRFQSVLIEPVEFLPLAVGIGLAVRRRKVGRGQPLVLPAVDASGQLPRGPALFIEPLGLDQLLEHAQLIVGVDDRVIGLKARQLGMAAQHLGGDGVERAQPRHPFDRRADQMPDPLLHFPRGLVGEGDAENLARPGQPAAHDMGQPRGQRRGLAGAGPGQHQHRALGSQHGFALRRVQPVKQRVGKGFVRELHLRTTREHGAAAQGFRLTGAWGAATD